MGSRRALTDAEKVSAPVRAVLELGGLAVLAHPLHPQRAWTDLAQARLASGVEVWSGDSAWGALRQQPLTRLLPALGTALVSPERAMVYALAEARPVEDWLLALDGPAPKLAFCGLDAHGYPSYGAAFRWMSMHLTGIAALPEAAAEGAQAVVQELRSARFYCAVDALAPAAGFAVLPADWRTFRVGEMLEVRLPAVHPPGIQVRVHGPGRMVDTSHVRLGSAGAGPAGGPGGDTRPRARGRLLALADGPAGESGGGAVRRALYVLLSTLLFLVLAPLLLLARKTRGGLAGAVRASTGRRRSPRVAGRGSGFTGRAPATSRRWLR